MTCKIDGDKGGFECAGWKSMFDRLIMWLSSSYLWHAFFRLAFFRWRKRTWIQIKKWLWFRSRVMLNGVFNSLLIRVISSSRCIRQRANTTSLKCKGRVFGIRKTIHLIKSLFIQDGSVRSVSKVFVCRINCWLRSSQHKQVRERAVTLVAWFTHNESPGPSLACCQLVTVFYVMKVVEKCLQDDWVLVVN